MHLQDEVSTLCGFGSDCEPEIKLQNITFEVEQVQDNIASGHLSEKSFDWLVTFQLTWKGAQWQRGLTKTPPATETENSPKCSA